MLSLSQDGDFIVPNANAIAGRGAGSTLVRLPEELRERLRSSAVADRRSMNSQIIVLLERALPPEQTKTADPVAAGPAE